MLTFNIWSTFRTRGQVVRGRIRKQLASLNTICGQHSWITVQETSIERYVGPIASLLPHPDVRDMSDGKPIPSSKCPGDDFEVRVS